MELLLNIHHNHVHTLMGHNAALALYIFQSTTMAFSGHWTLLL